MLFRFTGPELEDLANRYLWAPLGDLLLSDEKLTAQDEPGKIYWALGDNLNTVRDIARYDPQINTTMIVNHRRFDAFGNMTSQTNPAVDLLFALTGRMFDRSTGMQNNLHHWYEPAVGCWVSEGATGFAADGLNLYRYVRKDRLTGRDSAGAGCMAGAPVSSPLRPGDF
ncbi:MAG: RHS repeat-associated core domain-containing protein [Thermoguttaceae bacterium]